MARSKIQAAMIVLKKEIEKLEEPTFLHRHGQELRNEIGEHLYPYLEEFGCGDDDVVQAPKRMADKHKALQRELCSALSIVSEEVTGVFISKEQEAKSRHWKCYE